jgi:hypothetical protein
MNASAIESGTAAPPRRMTVSGRLRTRLAALVPPGFSRATRSEYVASFAWPSSLVY